MYVVPLLDKQNHTFDLFVAVYPYITFSGRIKPANSFREVKQANRNIGGELVFSPESEYDWVLWTRGSVLSSAPSLRGQSPHYRHLHPPLVNRLSCSTGRPSAGNVTCCWVWWIWPIPQRRQDIGWRGERQHAHHSNAQTEKKIGQQLDHIKTEDQMYLHVTWPQISSPSPRKTHHIHFSRSRGLQLNGFPPNCTITICTTQSTRQTPKTWQIKGRLSFKI